MRSLVDDGRHAVEMIGPRRAAKIVGQVADLDSGAEARGIHFHDVGHEDEVGAGLAELVDVAGLVARIGAEVLARAELGRVYEDRDDDSVGGSPGKLDQRQMAVMQRAHGRHERHRLAGLAPFGEMPAELGQGPGGGDCLGHGVS